MLPLSALVAAAALCGATFAITSATAQTPPAAAPAAPAQQQMTSDGKPCGAVAYSVAEQKYVGIPCNASTQQTSDGKPCGPVRLFGG
jgi:hypothetical protein